MSQESQPPRSRREARMQARRAPSTGLEQRGQVAVETPRSLDAVPVVPSRTAGPERSRGAADAPAGSERASQARARDREARQAFNALTGALPKIGPDPAVTPTRRQLRMQQLGQEKTGGTGAVAPPSAPSAVAPLPAMLPETAALSAAAASAAPGKVDAEYHPERPALRGGRRDRRERERTGQQDIVAKADLSPEEAVAAREELMGHAAGLANLIEAESGHDPGKVDLKLLAEQKALAERAAVLNRRAADKQRLSQETRQGRESAGTPAALRDPMSAPMEFVRLPGSDVPVMRPAATKYVPVVTDPTPAQQATAKPVTAPQPAPKPAAAAKPRTGQADTAPKGGTGRAAPQTRSARTQPVAKVQPEARSAAAPKTQPISAVKPAPQAGAGNRTAPVPVVKPAAAARPAPQQAGSPQGARSRLLAKAEAAAGGTAAAQPPKTGAQAGRRTEAPAPRRTETPAGRRTEAPATRRSEAGPAATGQVPATRGMEASAMRRSEVRTAGSGQAPATRRSNTPATRRTEAPATRRREVLAAAVVEGGIQPLRATRAHGLDPLDANTAGLARANRDRLLVIGSLALGGLAFALGLIMMMIGLAH